MSNPNHRSAQVPAVSDAELEALTAPDAPNVGEAPQSAAAQRYESNRDRFLRAAKAALPVTIEGQTMLAQRKVFSTGSVGYYGQGKSVLLIDGQPVLCQVATTITVIGSKGA